MFSHLHVHSHYSLLDGLAKIDELIAAAKKNKMSALGLSDHGTLYGAIEFYKKAREAGVKPIIGSEVYLAPHSRFDKKIKIDTGAYHLVLLAKNDLGYKNLIKLVTLAHLEGFYYKPRIDFELLKKYHEGLIALTACCQGEIPQLIIKNQFEKAEKKILEYQEIFNDDFYLEVQHHPGFALQEKVNQFFYEIAKKHHLKIVATNDVHYIKKEDAEVQDVLLCLQTKKKKNDKDRLSMLSDDFSFRSQEEMMTAFAKHPEAIESTKEIAAKCNLEIKLGEYKLPLYPLPAGKTAEEYLEALCEERISLRYPQKTKEISDRLQYELEVIKKTGFAPYFLIVQDFVNWAKKNKIVVGPGRGSVPSSIVSYVLGITDIDPLKYNLIFERFLNPDRISMPDIDLDFADVRRDEVLTYITEKYGKDHVSQIITFGTMAARAAIRDVGRVLDYPYNFCDKLAKLVPMGLSLAEALEVPDLKRAYETNKDVKKIIDIAKRLEGVARHASRHACGLIITPTPLVDYLPLQYDVSGQEKSIISQYEMHSIEDLGLLKIDLLGLKNLTLIETALNIIKHIKGKEIKIEELPLDDKKTFSLFQKAETTGVFQMESDGFKRYLKQLKPTNIDDLIAIVALYRPGPMELIPEYIAGKHEKKKIIYLHPKLKPILEKTYGVCVYQEQLLQIARDLAGFSLAEADILRKAVGKKIAKLLKEQKDKFIEGCIKNKISKETAEEIFSFIEPFAGYGFNKSHATCYAAIAYQTAYLKANYPAAFMAALLTSDQNDLDRIAIEVEEAKKMGLSVLPPDINESYENFTVVDDNKIRFGLLAIKNVGQGVVKNILHEREENGNFTNLEDFLSRLSEKETNKKTMESLIKSGSLDKFGERKNLLENLESLIGFAKKKQKDKENGQKTIFSFFAGHKTNIHLKKVSPASSSEKLFWEKELLGLFVSSHPLEEYAEIIKKYAQPINEIQNNREIKIIGLISEIKKILTGNKENMLFVKLEDPWGKIEAIIFPKIMNGNENVWQKNKIIFVSGRTTDKDGELKVIAEKVKLVSKEALKNLLIKSENKI
ncbi:DNA polymerase III subunit alpha [Candidatus Kuenenbacteria bacterium]|nr:DNA polymerase III subunit alpha [Candidatus Kuenenbacteria bacterium]PIZ90366.1 MAG: DNA polymerase III subunit alpha [bacterium (Candidatus Moisslbacteria) CG_4_10_14_0_2_um_filter_36_61]PJC00562.1 MAG: DNA polymerase III subunit alpha [bacterium (Candidatus Moisslbacteria) CG_4_9_14_0_8_um_filter_36_20]